MTSFVTPLNSAVDCKISLKDVVISIANKKIKKKNTISKFFESANLKVTREDALDRGYEKGSSIKGHIASDEFEHEDWQKLYEQFTTTGRPMLYKCYGSTENTQDYDVAEYNTTILEEKIYGVSIKILRLRNLMEDVDSQDGASEADATRSYTSDGNLSRRPLKKTDDKCFDHLLELKIKEEDTESDEMESVPRDCGLEFHDEQGIVFKNPFPVKEVYPDETIPKKGTTYNTCS